MYPNDKIAYHNHRLTDAVEHKLDSGIRVRHAPSRVFSSLSSLGFGAIATCGALFGIWGVTCLACGILASSPEELLAGLFTAIAGF